MMVEWLQIGGLFPSDPKLWGDELDRVRARKKSPSNLVQLFRLHVPFKRGGV